MDGVYQESAQTAADAAAMAALLQFQSTTFSLPLRAVGGVVCQAPTSCNPAPNQLSAQRL